MDLFKTFNNHICKSIIRNACLGQFRAVYMQIYNCHDKLTDDLLSRVYNLCFEIAPLTIDVFKTLPLEVQNYYNALWHNSLKK